MTKLDIYEPYIEGFREDDKVCFFENFGGFWAYQEPQLIEKIREIEAKHNCLVYAVTHEFTDFGECYDFLIVTDYKEEWKTLLQRERNAFYAFAYVWNKDDDVMKKVFIVQFDWSTTDAEGIDLYVYGSYDKAYDKFKELICTERNPDTSWVGDVEFDDDGYPTDERYELSFEDNNSCESEVYWHIVDKDDWNRHSFIDLLVKEVL